MELFLKGIAAGFIIAVPLGPVSMLCFRRVLTHRLLAGLLACLGAAAADTLYGLIAALGLTAVSHTLLAHHALLRACGGVFLLYLGIRMIRTRAADPAGESKSARNLPGVFFSSLLLMLANPTIILSFIGVFAALDLHAAGDGFHQATWLGAGIFLGSSLWWVVYKLAAFHVGGRLTPRGLRGINASIGGLICAFGVWQLIDLIRGK